MKEPRVRDLIRALVAAAIIACAVTPALATQPECTGDRHYDGVACCPATEPELCEPCAPVLPCPDPAPCQPVTCEDGDDGDTTVINVDRCPEPEVLETCKVRKNGTTVCYRSRATKGGRPGPRRILVPRSIMEKIADEQRGY